MAGYEYTCIIGNVGRDPEMRYLQNGTAVCSFSVAVTSRWNDRNSNEKREKTNWYRITAWRGLGETCNKYVRKGMQIMVAGTVTASAYMGQDGEPRATIELTARDVQFLGNRGEGGGEMMGGGGGGNYSQGGGGNNYDSGGNYDSEPPTTVDDIPF